MDNNTDGKETATASKVKKLQNQYNKILMDLFGEHAKASIEDALEGNEGSLGENIDSIVQAATDTLRTKVLEDLGIAASCGDDMVAVTAGGFDMGGAIELGTDGDDAPDMDSDGDSEDEEEEVAEEGKLPPGLAAYMAKKNGKKSDKDSDGDSDGDSEDDCCKKCECDPCECDKEKVDESYTAHYMSEERGASKPENHGTQSAADKSFSVSRRNDQDMLTEAYGSMYNK